MYSTCLYCHKPLGENEVVETFPVGRRLAFDQRRGRLWVVCRKCEKWNLSPFEDRWDAIEDCERRFHDARKRVASDNIGLARLDEGLELVRIGEPLRHEFAAWRYGDQFGRRRRKNMLVVGGIGTVGVGLVLAADLTGILSGSSYSIWQAVQAGTRGVQRRRLVARVEMPNGQRLTVRGKHVEKAILLLPEEEHDGIHLRLPHEAGSTDLAGYHARRAAALIMPGINRGGAKQPVVDTAVAAIEAAGDPVEYVRRTAVRTQTGMILDAKKEKHRGVIQKLDLGTRLAIEMAVNEENERHALAGELELLELEWKDAEEIAAIADTLGVPESVERQLEEMKQRMGRGGESENPR